MKDVEAICQKSMITFIRSSGLANAAVISYADSLDADRSIEI